MLREGAEPTVLLSELFDPEADARGVETLLLALTGVTGAAIGGGRTGSARADNCDIICGKGIWERSKPAAPGTCLNFAVAGEMRTAEHGRRKYDCMRGRRIENLLGRDKQ